MEHISKIIQRSEGSNEQTASPMSQPSKTSISPDHISLLWVRMAEIYGHKWVSSHGEKDSGTWQKGLADKSTDDIARGIAGCVKRDDHWPPSLPEFRDMCKKPITPFTGTHKALPKPQLDPKEIESNIQALRERLR